MARSKSSASARTLRIRSSPASPSICSRSSAVRRRKFVNSARSRWSPARYSSARVLAAASSPCSPSMSARSFVGETSSSSIRSWERVLWTWGAPGAPGDAGLPLEPGTGGRRKARGSGMEMLHQLIEKGGDEPDGADRLGIGHARRAEDAHHADGVAGLSVRGEDQGHVTHLFGCILRPDEDIDRPGPGDPLEQLAEVGAVLERLE